MKNLFILVIILSAAACSPSPEKNSASGTLDSTAQRIERGRYLVQIGGCNDCHSPKMMTDKGPVPDPALLLSGHPSAVPVAKSDTSTTNYWLLFHPMGTAARGPWGTSFAANLTPDPTGLGNWSEQQFFNAMRKGWYKGMEGTRMLLPLMPWQNYTEMSDEDLKSIFAYLKSIKPVNNVVPAPLPPM